MFQNQYSQKILAGLKQSKSIDALFDAYLDCLIENTEGWLERKLIAGNKAKQHSKFMKILINKKELMNIF